MIYLELKDLVDENSDNLCFSPVFIILRFGGELVVFIFFVIGVIITNSVQKFKGRTIYEQTYQMIMNKRALIRLWIVILSFTFVCLYLLIYDLFVMTNGSKTCN